MKSQYVLLVDLISDWAAQSGELESRIITHLCEYEARGRISPEAFRHPSTGGYPNPGALSELVNQMRQSGHDYIRSEAAGTLQVVVVSKEHVLTLCRTYGIRPPRCVIGLLRWYSWRDYLHEAIPPFIATPEELESEQQAAAERIKQQENFERLHAKLKGKAEESLNGLDSIILDMDNDLQRKSKNKHWAECDKKWEKQVAVILEIIGEISDIFVLANIRTQLQDLESRYQETKSHFSDTNSKSKKRGRKPGDGLIDDTEAVNKALKMIENGEAKSVNAAAEKCADGLKGQSWGATVDRLRRKIKDKQKKNRPKLDLKSEPISNPIKSN